MLEARTLWSSTFQQSSTRRFRETSNTKIGDLNTSWLSSLLLVERARESMLWVWAVAKMGGASGVWGKEEKRALEALFQGQERGTVRKPAENQTGSVEETIRIRRGRRETISPSIIAEAFKGLEWERPVATRYSWCKLTSPYNGWADISILELIIQRRGSLSLFSFGSLN